MKRRQLKNFIRMAGLEVFAEPGWNRYSGNNPRLRNLENLIEIDLFAPLPGGEDTAAARALLIERAHKLLEELEQMKAQTQVANVVRSATLKIGVTCDATCARHLPAIIRELGNNCPNIGLELIPSSSANQPKLLARHEIDLGFVYWLPKSHSFLEYIEIKHEGLMLAVAASNELARRRTVSASELNDLPFIWFRRNNSPHYYDLIETRCRSAGVTFDVVYETAAESTMLSLVAADVGVTLVTEAEMCRKVENVVFLPVKDLNASLTLKAIWRARDTNPALQDLLAAIQIERP